MTSRRFLIVACLMIATGGVLRAVAARDLAPEATALNALPLQIGDWRGQDAGRLDRDTEAVLQADSYLMRTYARGQLPVDLFVAYYATQRSGHTIHSPLNCLPGTGWEWVTRRRAHVALRSGQAIEINANVARKNGQEDLVYYWYQSHGRAEASEFRNKILLVRDALTLHRSEGALVRVTAPVRPGDAPAEAIGSFIGALVPVLTRHLPE
jgi:EpsI family protein